MLSDACHTCREVFCVFFFFFTVDPGQSVEVCVYTSNRERGIERKRRVRGNQCEREAARGI